MSIVDMIDQAYKGYRNASKTNSVVHIKISENAYHNNKYELDTWKANKNVQLVLINNKGDISNGNN